MVDREMETVEWWEKDETSPIGGRWRVEVRPARPTPRTWAAPNLATGGTSRPDDRRPGNGPGGGNVADQMARVFHQDHQRRERELQGKPADHAALYQQIVRRSGWVDDDR